MRIVSAHFTRRAAFREAGVRAYLCSRSYRPPHVQVVRGQRVGLRRWQVIER